MLFAENDNYRDTPLERWFRANQHRSLSGFTDAELELAVEILQRRIDEKRTERRSR